MHGSEEDVWVGPDSRAEGQSRPTPGAGDPFDGPGEVRRLCRDIDWAATPLGPVRDWPAELRSTVRACLDSPFPINLWCGDELVLVYNDAYRHVLGAKHPALGRRGAEVWAEIWHEIGPLFQRIRDGGSPAYAADAPFLVRRATGEDTASEEGPNAWFTFALSAVRDDAGRVVAFLNIVSETTGRVLAERASAAARASAERAEARLRDIFAQAPAFMAVVRGEKHIFEYANEAYYQLVGRRELIGRPVFEALPEVRGQGFEALLDGVLRTGEPFVGREVVAFVARHPEAPPEQRFLDIVYYPITEADGTRSGVVAHGSDVTDHVLARREAQHAREDAEKASQAKSQFLANMSHEIRTPINAVIGYTDLLDAGIAGTLGERQMQYVERIRDSSRHLLALVDDVLDLSRIEAGEVLIRAEEVQAGGVVDAAIQIVAAEADQRGLQLREEWQCPADTRLTADVHRTRQVLLNLLSNALKFTLPGGVIGVRCRICERPDPAAALPETGPWVVIDVEDSGTGIPADQLDRIFDAFVQVDDSHTRRAGGTGLGLAISRRFARLMGGDLTVHSTPGIGSCFSLWLPAAAQKQPAAQPPDRAEVPATPPDDTAALQATAELLLSLTDTLEKELAAHLMEEPDFLTEELDYVVITDHTAALLAVFARSLAGVPGADTAARVLLEDGEAFRSLMAERHGRQRRRLGWPRSHVQREYTLLRTIVETTLRRAAAERDRPDTSAALDVLHRLINAAELASLAGYDFAPADPPARSGPNASPS
jgi:PAS domain S-box-containing protein